MRVLIFAQSDDALRLLRAMPDACTLLGGMPPEVVEEHIKRFVDTPDAVMVATAAFDHGWGANVEAEVFFMDPYFGSRVQAYGRVKPPATPAPTVDDLKAAMAQRIKATPLAYKRVTGKARK